LHRSSNPRGNVSRARVFFFFFLSLLKKKNNVKALPVAVGLFLAVDLRKHTATFGNVGNA
jgi:hypothetical protein